MQKNHYQIVVVGGGTGGIMTAAQLLRKGPKKLSVAIIEPSDKHIYQPAFTLVGSGSFKMADTIRPEEKYIPKGATWLKDKVVELDPDNNCVKCEKGGLIRYDFLVLSPGISINLNLVEGLAEALEHDEVCSNYINPEKTWQVVQNFKGGNALYTQANTPIKCGGGPQKALYLGEDYFSKNAALRQNSNLIYAMPGSTIFGVEEFKKTLMGVVDERNLILKYSHQLFKVDGDKKIAYYRFPKGKVYDQLTHNDPNNKVGAALQDDVIEIPYDMMHFGPPMEAPRFLANSKLAHEEGSFKGFCDVNKHTMQHEKYSNVYGLGDAMGIPAAKTGAAIRKQTPVLVDGLLAQLEGKPSSNLSYNGYSSCPIVTGYGKMLLCEFDYDNKRDSDPLLSKIFDTTKDSYPMWILKKYGLPFLYWTQMLKGRM